MSKCLDNSLLVFSILLFNNVFLGMESMATQTNSNNSTQMPPQYQQQTNNTNGGASVVGQPIELKNINPTDTVAVVTGSGNSEPNVFKTDKKIFPSSFTGWVYIMSGADYMNYINDSNEQIAQQNNGIQQRRNNPNFTNNRLNSNVQQNGSQMINQNVQNSTSLAQQQTNIPQTANQQNINTQQPTVIQQPVSTQQATISPQNINDVASGSEKIEQGKPDNETPEVLIHDGAVYTLANSVEVTKPSKGNISNPVSSATQQTENTQLVQSQQLAEQSLVQPGTQTSTNTPINVNNESPVNNNNGASTNNNQPIVTQLGTIHTSQDIQNNTQNNMTMYNSMADNQQSAYQQQDLQNQNNPPPNNQPNNNQSNVVQPQN